LDFAGLFRLRPAGLAEIAAADDGEPDDAPEAVARAFVALEDRRAELGRLANWLEAEGRAHVVEGEEDARPMGVGRERSRPPTTSRRQLMPIPD